MFSNHFVSSGSFSSASAFAIITATGVFSSCDASVMNCFCLLNVSITGFIIQLVIFVDIIIIIISNIMNIIIDILSSDCSLFFDI